MSAILVSVGLLVCSAQLCYLAVGMVRSWATRSGMLAMPDHRSSHAVPVPVGGGLAIVVLATTAWVAYSKMEVGGHGGAIVAYAAGALLVAGISWADDRRPIAIQFRMPVHVLAAVIIVIGVGYWRIVELPLVGQLSLGNNGLPITILWIVGLISAYNFIDGIDGMAGSQGVVAGAGWMALGLMFGLPLVASLGALLAGTCLGFVFHKLAAGLHLHGRRRQRLPGIQLRGAGGDCRPRWPYPAAVRRGAARVPCSF